jgi:Ca2+-binding EF-hand superfamily protein
MEAFALKQIAEKRRKAEIAKLDEERNRTAGPVVISKEEQVFLNRLFGVPDAPVEANCCAKGVDASLWWALGRNSHVAIEPYVEWALGPSEHLRGEEKVVLEGAAAIKAAAIAAAEAATVSHENKQWSVQTIPLAKLEDGTMPPVRWDMDNEYDLEHNTTSSSGHGLSKEGQMLKFQELFIKVIVRDQVSGITVAKGEVPVASTDLFYEPPPPPPTPPDSDDEKPDEYIPDFDDFGQPVVDDNGIPQMKLKPRPDKKKKAKKKIEAMKKAKKRKKKAQKARAKIKALEEAGILTSGKNSNPFLASSDKRRASGKSDSRPDSAGSGNRPGTADSANSAKSTSGSDDDEPRRPGTAGSVKSTKSESEDGSENEQQLNDMPGGGVWPNRPPHASPWEDWMEDADAFDFNGDPLVYTKKGDLIPFYAPGPDPYNGLDISVQLYDAREELENNMAGIFMCRMRREKIIPPDEQEIPEDETPEQRKERKKEEKRKKKEEKKRKKKEDKARAKAELKAQEQGIDPEDAPKDEAGKDPDDPDAKPEVDPNLPTDILHLERDLVVNELRPVSLSETIIGWEVHRYRQDANKWLYKGYKTYEKMDHYAVTVENLTETCTYRFTVKARNRIGLSPESDPSNPCRLEAPLPAGWFRFYNDAQNKFYYANIKTRQSRWKRPDLDPYFLEEWVCLQFDASELAHLQELYNEEMMHFDKVSVKRFVAIMRECGEALKRRATTNLFRGLVQNDEELYKWSEFMTIVSHIKKKKQSPVMASVVPIGAVYFLSRAAVSSLMGDGGKKLGKWRTEWNEVAEKQFYVHTETGEMQWEMPDAVRFYIPAKLEDKLLKHFNPGQLEKFKIQFSQIDVDGSGDISDREMRLLLESMGVHLDDSTFKKLINIVDLNGNGTIEYVKALHHHSHRR